ncbi:hypothetical protein NQZ68_042126 [Dissostichus eleginoides]|nr:hypothetical protein NQZ68_042126 [Dissostichus eleginoides]
MLDLRISLHTAGCVQFRDYSSRGYGLPVPQELWPATRKTSTDRGTGSFWSPPAGRGEFGSHCCAVSAAASGVVYVIRCRRARSGGCPKGDRERARRYRKVTRGSVEHFKSQAQVYYMCEELGKTKTEEK